MGDTDMGQLTLWQDEITFNEFMEMLRATPRVFWVCPNRCCQIIKWTTNEDGTMTAECQACLRKSEPQTPSPVNLPPATPEQVTKAEACIEKGPLL